MPMDLAPRSTIDDGLIEGRPCFVCGGHALHAVHVEGIPDYVACSDCQSAFVLDVTGDWLMYGKIHADYAEARRVALRQWASPEEVMRSAAEDRRLAAVELAAESLPEATAADGFPEPPSENDLPTPRAQAGEPLEQGEVEDLEAAAMPALFAIDSTLEDKAPAAQEFPGIPSEEADGDLDDFTSRLAALAGVPIEDFLFDTEEDPLGEDAVLRDALLGIGQGPAAGGEASDDWLVLPEEPAPWQLPQPPAPAAEVAGAPRSLWHSEQPDLDLFALSPLANAPPPPEAAEAPIALGDQAAGSPVKLAPAATLPPDHGEGAAVGPAHEAPADPPPGLRYRTVIRGTKVQLPRGACAHCMATPARHKLNVRGSLPAGQVLGQRRPTRFAIPLCSRCHKRAGSRTPEERSARLQAYLISALVALFVLIVTLLLNVVDLQGGNAVSGLLLLIILVLGYAIPAVMLSSRANRFLPPEDALYVQTTLLVPEETQGLETAFEWRNREYAERFLGANQEAILGRAIEVKDRSALPG
jgi:hypothetical protein